MKRFRTAESRVKMVFVVLGGAIALEWIAIAVAGMAVYGGYEALGVASNLAGLICGLIGFFLSLFVGWNLPQYRKRLLAFLIWSWVGAVIAAFFVPAFFTA